jgi:hypothetical protein
VSVEVPDVVGMSRTDAQIALAAARLVPRIRTVKSDEPEGTVTGQKPAGGKSAQAGSTVTLTVSKGPGPAEVSATVELTDDGDSIRANKEDITVPKGSLVRVSLSTTITNVIEANQLNADGPTRLANGDSVTLSANTATNDGWVACPGLGPFGWKGAGGLSRGSCARRHHPNRHGAISSRIDSRWRVDARRA